jgi:hypothetical protein
MTQKHRITTNIGSDQFIKVEIKQDFDLLEILSLKFTQKEVYTSLCADYGVVCGRIIVNNGFGVPNAKVSIFIPLSEEDEDDPVISALYPYKNVSDKNEDNYRYNLLPSRKQHGGHQPTGTFPDQLDVLNREEILEVYEKYYKYTVKTNSAGDFMIWGVPLGTQTIHVDLDLSDIGCFSLRPYDFITNGVGLGKFKNEYTFAASSDIGSLPQIVTFNKTIEVFPFWGNEDLCEIGITRTDFDLSDNDVKIEPKAYLIGGTYTDTGKNSINKNCQPRAKMGRKCDLTTKAGTIEAIRFTNRLDDNNLPILERLEIDGEIDSDGAFFVELPMNSEYVYTNEFGETEISNDPNKGIPTAACYRLRFSLNDQGLDRVRSLGNYIVPNIREYASEKNESYAFSTNWEDYPNDVFSTNPTIMEDRGALYKVNGEYIPRDYFYRFTYNKVYTVSSFQSSYFKGNSFNRDKFLGIKEIVPTEEEDCSSEIVTPPVNFGVKNFTFQLLIVEVLLFFEQIVNLVTLTFFNVVVKVLHGLANFFNFPPVKGIGNAIKKFAYEVQESGQRELFLINYPECEECNNENQYGKQVSDDIVTICKVGEIQISGSTDENNRTLIVNVVNFTTPDVGDCLSVANTISDIDDFIANQNSYVLEIGGVILESDGFVKTSPTTMTYQDTEVYFSNSQFYTVSIRDPNSDSGEGSTDDNGIEEGCLIYDIPYDEELIEVYYSGTPESRITITYVPGTGQNVSATKVGGDTTGTNYELLQTYSGQTFNVLTPSGFSEFSNGIFYVIPGTQSNGRLFQMLKEYRRRKRVGKLFCGGIVNYSFIDNWLSGSLYFFQFKSKSKNDGDRQKYCTDIVHYVNEQEKFYYRSSPFNGTTFGSTITGSYKRIGRPTTFVDLGPRDEFIKEICVDPTLDPNCSVARSIGPTSFQSFGEILGLAINYRMDVGNNEFDINNFFDNTGNTFTNRVLDGDLLQLISINNEVGIEEFDLQSPKYLGYSYQILDPESNSAVFKKGSYWGPTPITLDLSEDGERIRLCINQPGRLTESSQKVPFFLWDKKGTGFGGTNEATSDDQFWDYTSSGIQVQPLQGMTYGYLYSGSPNNPAYQYLLQPITNTFSGLTLSTNTNVTDEIPFDIVNTTNLYTNYHDKYPGFTVLHVTGGTISAPTAGTLYTRVGPVSGTTTYQGITITNGWYSQSWSNTQDFIIKPTIDYYSGNKQILSTPFQYYFGLRSGKTGIDKFITLFGPQNAFTTEG